jgi:hypothetical protein
VLARVLGEILQFLHEQPAHHVLLEIIDLLPLELIDHLLDLSICHESHQWVIILDQFQLIVHVVV